MNLLCISDIHGRIQNLRRVLDENQDCDLVILAGDMTQLGGRRQVEKVIEPVLEARHPVLAVPGNMDKPEVLEVLDARKINLHGKGVIIGGIGFCGLGGSNTTPFDCPFAFSEEEMAGLLQRGFAQIEEAAARVLVSHAPPLNSLLDRVRRRHVGSRAVREFIESQAVMLCVCGHIHESASDETLGGARCVNTGDFRSGHYALITVEAGSDADGQTSGRTVKVERRRA